MIIAIGGGEIVSNETYEIDKFIVESAKKENPNFLFIPTASKDAEAYIETINDYFGSLGCKTDTLYLSNTKVRLLCVSTKHIREKMTNKQVACKEDKVT